MLPRLMRIEDFVGGRQGDQCLLARRGCRSQISRWKPAFLVGDPEIVFKFRHPDFGKAALVDVRPEFPGSYRVKFKVEVLPRWQARVPNWTGNRKKPDAITKDRIERRDETAFI